MAQTPTPPASSVKPAVTATATAAPKAAPAQVQATQQAVKPPSFKITPLKNRARYLKMLVYGNYGVGKTHLAGTACEVPQMRDILLINAEAGDLTIQDFKFIDEVTVQNFNTLARVHEFLTAHCFARESNDEAKMKELQERLFGTPVDDEEFYLRRYKTVIIDSLAEVNAYCLNQLLGVSDATKLDEDPLAAEFKEYKQNNTMILRMVRKFRNLPMNIIFTCPEDYVQDEMKRHHYTPAMTGKLSKQVQGFMDMVGYYVQATATEEPGKGVKIPRRLYVVPDQKGKHDAKHRYAKFKGTHFENPTMSKILDETGLLDKDGALLKD